MTDLDRVHKLLLALNLVALVIFGVALVLGRLTAGDVVLWVLMFALMAAYFILRRWGRGQR